MWGVDGYTFFHYVQLREAHPIPHIHTYTRTHMHAQTHTHTKCIHTCTHTDTIHTQYVHKHTVGVGLVTGTHTQWKFWGRGVRTFFVTVEFME